jgi:hypothetical protein
MEKSDHTPNKTIWKGKKWLSAIEYKIGVLRENCLYVH